MSNYIAHALDDLQDRIAQMQLGKHPRATHLQDPFETLVQRLRSSIKFQLPDNGVLLGINDPLPALREFRRLPYPSIAIEYTATSDELSTVSYLLKSTTEKTRERILLCWEEEDGRSITIQPISRVEGPYMPHEAALKFYPTEKTGFQSDLVLFSPGSTLQLLAENGVSVDRYRAAINRNFVSHLRILGDFLSALSCKNVVTVDAAPSAALNKARTRRGKQPFFTYKTLVLTTAIAPAGPARGGTHASPRAHLRRGHIRRLPSGNIWVNAAVVGSKKLGFAHKDYDVRQPA